MDASPVPNDEAIIPAEALRPPVRDDAIQKGPPAWTFTIPPLAFRLSEEEVRQLVKEITDPIYGTSRRVPSLLIGRILLVFALVWVMGFSIAMAAPSDQAAMLTVAALVTGLVDVAVFAMGSRLIGEFDHG